MSASQMRTSNKEIFILLKVTILWVCSLNLVRGSCQPPSSITNGVYVPSQTVYSNSTTVTYTCNTGYDLTGDAVLTCIDTDQWDVPVPDCTRVTCAPPPDVSSATYAPNLGTNHDYGSSVTYSCDIAYTHTSGNNVRYCQQDSTWTGTDMVCERYACIPENSPLMYITPNQAVHPFGVTIIYNCNIGYKYSTGDVSRTCQTNGEWDGTLPECVIITCPPPGTILHASYTPVQAVYDWNTAVVYACDSDWHYTSGVDTTTCNEHAVFPAVNLQCSVQHYYSPTDTVSVYFWLNPLYGYVDIYDNLDAYCTVGITIDPPALIAVIANIYHSNAIRHHVYMYQSPSNVYRPYTITTTPYRGTRTWTGYNRTVFVGYTIQGISAMLNNPSDYIAVGDSYSFDVHASQGSSVTLTADMDDGHTLTHSYDYLFYNASFHHTYHTPGHYEANITLSNLISEQSSRVSVVVIYKINGLEFSVTNNLTDTSTNATFQISATAAANIPMDLVNITIDYKDDTGTTDELDLRDAVILPVTLSYTHLYNVQGEYVVTATANNHVNTKTLVATVNIWDSLIPLDFIYNNGTGKYKTNDTATFHFINTPDNGYEYLIEYGDNGVDASAGDNAIYTQSYNLSLFSHLYTLAGLRTVRWRAWNGAYIRDETFTVLIQNKVPNLMFTLEPIGKKYPWANLQTMDIPINITVNESMPLPTGAICLFDPGDGKPQVHNLQFNNAILNHLHSYTSEGEYNATYSCLNEVSNYIYQFNLKVEKFQASSLSVWFNEVVPLNMSDTITVYFHVDSGGYALIPDNVYLEWDWGDSDGPVRKRRAQEPYDTAIFSHLYSERDNFTITVQVQAPTTNTTNTLTYSLRVGVMYFVYSHTVAFINYTTIHYVMYGFHDPATFTLHYNDTANDSCASPDFHGCSIDYMCPSYGYMHVTAVARNSSLVEVSFVNVTCDNPIPEDMSFTFPHSLYIPDGWISYNFSIKPTDLFLPHLTCDINFGDPVLRKNRVETQEVTANEPYTGNFQYIAIGIHLIEVDCWNLINRTYYTQSILVKNRDFLLTGTFDRRFSQPESPLLVSSFHDTAIFSRLVIVANHTTKTHYNQWSINTSMENSNLNRQDLLFTREVLHEGLYYIELKVAFIQEPNNSIFEPTWVQLVMPPPHVDIIGGGRRLVRRDNVTVDALTLSYDPARPTSPTLSFTWTCASFNADSFEHAASQHSAASLTSISCDVTGTSLPGVVFLNTNNYPDWQYYVIGVTVDNGRGASASQRQILKIDSYDELSILCKFNCLAKTAVTSDKQLVPNIDHNCPSTYEWDLKMYSNDSYSSSMNLSAITKSGYRNQSLTINANSLAPGTSYLITLSVVMNRVSKIAYYEFVTNLPPRGGTCQVIPYSPSMLPENATLPEHPSDYSNMTEYMAGSSLFNLTCSNWQDEGYSDRTFTQQQPLFYFFFLSYNKSDDRQRQILYFDPGSTSNIVTFQSGDPDHTHPYAATVVLRIIDVFGDYAEIKYDVISKPGIKTEDLAPLSTEDQVERLRQYIENFDSSMIKSSTTYDYRALARQAMDIVSVYNQLELNTSSSVTLTPEDLLSLGYKENSDGERISWSDYWRLIVEVVDTSTTDILIQASVRYTTMLYESIITWPSGTKITIVAIDTMSRGLASLMNRTENTNVTAAKLAAECADIMSYNLAQRTAEKPFPNTEMIMTAAIGSLIRNTLLALQTVLTPNLPVDPTTEDMRKHLEYNEIFKSAEETAGELSLQEQTFLAQKQLQKYYLAKQIKSDASKIAMPKLTESLRNLTVVFQRLTSIGQQEIALEDDLIYVSTEIVPAYALEGFSITRPKAAMDVTSLVETNPMECKSSAIYIRTIIFKSNPYFWGTFADRITSVVPVIEIDGATLVDDTLTFRLANHVTPECIDETPTYDADDPNKVIYLLFDRMHGDDDILLFIRPNTTDLVYEVYFRKGEKPDLIEQTFDYSTEIKTDKWTKEDGYKLMITSTEFSATGKIWIALRPLLEVSTNMSLLQLPFCANVTSVNCLAWRQDVTGEFFWDKTLCEVSRASSRAETECICRNPGNGTSMTVGTTFYVPPSKTDFHRDISNTMYGRGPVIGIIITTMMAYLLIVCWAWREDIKDQYKWSYALLIDNDIADSYFYIIKVYTGLRAGSGTNSRVGFLLMGEHGDTGERILDDESHMGFERGSIRTFVMSTRRKLGELEYLRIWHDDSGPGPSASWFLAKVTVTDLQNDERYVFHCDKWLTYEFADQVVVRALVAEPFDTSKSFKSMLTYTLINSHGWLSVFLRPIRSNFTRTQRLASLLGLVYLSMIVCVLILKVPDEYDMNQIVIGPFRFSVENFWTSLTAVTVASVIIWPVTFLFCNAETAEKTNDVNSFSRRTYRRINDKLKIDKSVLATTYESPAESTVTYDYHFLPHFCVHIGWTTLGLAVLIPTYLLVLASGDWTLVKSEELMTSVCMASLISILIVEPIKILVLLLFYSMLCPLGYESLDPYVDKDKLKEITRRHSATLVYGPQFENDLKPPINPDKETLIRNKINRIRDHQLLRIFSQLMFFSSLLYLVYTISYQSRDPLSFYLKNHVEQSYVFQKEVTNMDTYIQWLNGTFINAYFSHSFFGADFSEASPGEYTLYSEDLANVRVGPARLRQLRVLPEDCKGPLGKNQTCRNKFREDKSDTGDYCLKWNPQPCDVSQKSEYFTSRAWIYETTEEVWGIPTVAEYATYGGGGFFMKLDVNMQVSSIIFEELIAMKWFDEKTRVVILEFTVYNGNANLFCYSKLVTEFPEVGGVVTFLDIQVFRLYTHYGPDGNYILFLEFIFLLCVLASTMFIAQNLATDAKSFLTSVWNLLDMLALVMSYTTISCYIYKLIITQKTLDIFYTDQNAYVGFENLVFYDIVTNTSLAVLVFLLSLRVSRILGYSGKINEMAAVIYQATDDLLAFVVIFGITYFAYVAYGTLLFGKDTAKYRDMFQTYGTLTEAVIGKNRLENILTNKPGFAEFYYFSFVLFVLMTLATMAAAILNFSITNVKQETEMLAPTNIVEVILDRMASLVRWLGKLTNKGSKPSNANRRDSESEIGEILSDLRHFLRSVDTNGKSDPALKYRVMSPDGVPSFPNDQPSGRQYEEII